MIKLVVSDMDGTLLNTAAQISPKNQKAIEKLKENGIEFAIASGRDYESVYSVMKEFHVDDCEAILGNGAQYVDRQGNVVMSCYMNKDVVKDVVNIFAKNSIPYMIFTTHGFYTEYETNYVRKAFIERANKYFGSTYEDYGKDGKMANMPCNHLQKIDDFDVFLKKDIEIIKIEAFSLDMSTIFSSKELLKDIPTISYLSSFEDNIEVTDQNAQKGYILEKVIQIKGYQKDEVAVLGDGMNDLSLFECFPYSYAPNNAETKIKSLAYQVVCDCEEDGFAEAIELILKQK